MALAPARPALKMKVGVKLPAAFVEGPGISGDIENGLLTVGFDFPSLQDNAGIPDASIYTLVIYNKDTGEYEEAPLDQLRGSTVAAVRTPRGDADYAMISSDRYVGLTATLTAPRTWTLPDASAMVGGTQIDVMDEAGGIDPTNTLTIACVGAQEINNASTFVLNAPGAGVRLISNGVDAWTTAIVGTSNIADGALANSAAGRAKMANGFLSVDAAGRAKMADGYLSADATGRAKMADGFLTTAKAADGFLSADVSGRAKMADGFTTTAKLADGALSADVSGLAKMADGYLAASTAGLAKMADGYFAASTAGLAKMADGYLAASTAGRAKMADGFTTNAKLDAMPALTLKGSITGSGAPVDLTPAQLVTSYFPATSAIGFAAATPYVATTLLTATIPYDNTKPQIGEGTQILTATITLQSASSRVLLLINGWGTTVTAGDIIIAALFRNSVTDAIAAQPSNFVSATDVSKNFGFEWVDSPGVSGAVTYTVRVGGAVGNIVLNGITTGPANRLGGASAATLNAFEIKS